eukprot:CAMPEP_0206444070 /NCGR_PEP_ID=MMETSP0324_2-20121206/14714_1 /ASSEMBLY_ACC=CAM_ASM_000836 /TAXON_ID=2866 /ORGANISM="Crypthecodinium cohnii, Strain Seligo" /LENGTH=286 /DNA_ID=CAMNT_0053912065 /DNA_START=156 /DNA_END=1016 /DNA_ORIENTATION=-
MAPVTRVHIATGLAFALGFVAASSHLAAETQFYGEPGLDLEEECAAGDEECSLSLRQLRGEIKTAEVLTHEFQAGAAPKEAAEADAAPKASSKKKAKDDGDNADAEEDEDDEEDDGDDKDDKGEDEDEEDDEESDKDKASEDDTPKAQPPADGDWDDYFDGEEGEETRGAFCCQNGQGMGATDDADVGASCYPSSKPEPFDFCDSEDSCGGPCNGTWVVGWCALAQPEGKAEKTALCNLRMNAKGTGYNYESPVERAVMDDPCAASESDCLGCNGTWCEYIKTPFY